ncbi:MAG: 16S rRNA (cytosine(1402)-N(4))-methyltransferase RsmH [Bacilli bacterium]|nr:16S rRNA (cytosine(1402)-N(4))-methyltransferase RsmH [Bacilli bacterium]
MNNEHIPVLLNEVIENLNINPDGIYIDLTLGRAGHSSEILKRLSHKGKLIGFDQDIDAIQASIERLSKISSNFEVIKSNFENVKDELLKRGITKVDGILADLGVSSPQFDQGDRGFSYRFDAKLDMRMDQNANLSAYEIVNTYSLIDLTRIFREYGEEKYAYEIAKRIVREREQKPIETTFELVDIIKRSLPSKELSKKGHPAKQVFQALRIETNRELEVLETMLKDGLELLSSKGRMAIITFQSLEDRIVKNIFKEVSTPKATPRWIPSLPEDQEVDYQLINRKVIVASEEELKRNPRSESAKLRVIERK